MTRPQPAFTAVLVLTVAGTLAAQTLPSIPERLAEMKHHFTQVTLMHEALIRGELAAVRAPAEELAGLTIPPRVPASAGPYVELVREAGRRATTARTLDVAAQEVSMMLTLCGDCHRSVGISPVPSLRSAPDVGGIVGHMLEHQRAADQLLQGLIIPSTTAWNEGATRLKAAPLHRSELLPDRNMTNDIRSAETRVHALAADAERAATSPERAAAYGRILGNCAQCHSLHRQVWGPGRAR